MRREAYERAMRRARPDGECLIYTSSQSKDGYAQFREQIDGMRHRYRGSRIVWLMERGPIPEGLVIMHSCDNPACVKIDHLSLGTQAENLADMRAKGRWSRREADPV